MAPRVRFPATARAYHASMTFEAPTVYLLDDGAAVCKALRSLFESVKLKVKTYRETADLLAELAPSAPACLVLDVRMPRMTGLDLVEHLARNDVPLPVIMLTGFGDVALAVKAVKRGAIDFMEKPPDEHALLERVQEALRRNAECLAARRERAARKEKLAQLSQREREVISEVAAGKLSKEIAADLGLSVRTVETHRLTAAKKLNLRIGMNLIRFVSSVEGDDRCALGGGRGAWRPACRAAASGN